MECLELTLLHNVSPRHSIGFPSDPDSCRNKGWQGPYRVVGMDGASYVLSSPGYSAKQGQFLRRHARLEDYDIPESLVRAEFLFPPGGTVTTPPAKPTPSFCGFVDDDPVVSESEPDSEPCVVGDLEPEEEVVSFADKNEAEEAEFVSYSKSG